MKATTSNTLELNKPLKELSKFDLVMIKAAIAIFGTVLNICFVELIF